ncbi:glycosyltransferase [Vibrio breoganii]|uniref:Glycosyltransferase n=1 Tax=Vibrio breoganii TaxID=553239 RepID=A0ABX1UB07_9VIBR|nr:glycosyltransferase [Vibrio breoganii]NMO75047.1 glycosyltransferase family 4 protein [Vibrio breoganii]NMR71606.1 glycosyltransferase [Vibrio breoganii]PML87190.1 hypothetical protein BCT67_12500 [Vibrio breoganii]
MRHIIHILDQPMPPRPDSGGSNRLVEWLAQEQHSLGHKVTVIAPEGNKTIHFEFIRNSVVDMTWQDLKELLPSDATDIEIHCSLSTSVSEGIISCGLGLLNVIHGGNGHELNAIYVSRSHAQNNGKEKYIHNGIPEQTIEFDADKDDFLLFLAKVKRSKKGIATAIKIAKSSKTKLVVAGGYRFGNPETWFSWHPYIQPVGYINGQRKSHYLSKAKALLVPIKWEEPFGLTIVEAMLSGTPVIAFRRGAMSELIVDGKTGFLCDNEEQMLTALSKVSELNPLEIREHARNNFSSIKMAIEHLNYLDLSLQESW